MRWVRAAVLPAALVGIGIARAQNAPAAAQPSAQDIMAKVAVNQDLAVAERAHYVYVQHAKTVSRRGGRVLCQELTDYRVTPAENGSREDLLKVDGQMRLKHRTVNYTTLLPQDDDHKSSGKKGDQANKGGKPDPAPSSNAEPARAGKGNQPGAEAKSDDGDGDISINIGDDQSLDRELVENIRHGLMNDKSRDGIDAHLFPLTSKDQANYDFQLAGRERMNGRDVFHVIFRPKDRKDFGWRGDAYIDTAAYQPVLVTTGMSRKIPFAVRTFLGTNFPGLGFTVTYAPQPDGVWFPVTFSTEFKIEVLFFFRRTIILDAENRDFEKTHVTSRIVGDAKPVEPEQP